MLKRCRRNGCPSAFPPRPARSSLAMEWFIRLLRFALLPVFSGIESFQPLLRQRRAGQLLPQ